MSVLLVQGTARQIPLRDESVHCVCTSPPYWGLRSYGIGAEQGELGGEPLHDCLAWARQEPPCAPPQCWVCGMRVVFAEVHRVMRPEATLWCNVGDSFSAGRLNRADFETLPRPRGGHRSDPGYSMARAAPQGMPPKNLLGMPWRLALALQADGFILRSELIWHKLNPMPESVQDRPTRAHEQVFLFSKQGRYYYDGEAVREPHLPQSIVRAMLPHNGTIGEGKRSDQMAYSSAFADCHLNPAGRACRSVLSLASEPTPYAHFATMPTALVRRCLLAGCPRRVCSACGKPWVRGQVRTNEVAAHHNGSRFDVGKSAHHGHVQAGVRYVSVAGDWHPTCACAAPTRPAVVLDPFAGSGTVGLVARALGHDAVCLDLSLAYLRDIARERLGLAALHRWTNGSTPQPVDYTGLPLFAEDHA